MKYIPIGYFNNIAFGPESEVNLVIDNTANLASTKTLLDTLVNDDLKTLLLPFYGTEEKYKEKVKVVEDGTEQPYLMLTTFNLSSKNSFVFAFIDEATPYGDIYTTANPTVTSDINTLVNKVSGYKDEYKGFVFRVQNNGASTFGESYKLREVLNAVHNTHIPYTDTSYNQIQLPATRENQLFNRLDIANNSELTRFADLDSTEMETNSRYKYYGYEIIDALNNSVASLNLENDNSFLFSNINTSITRTMETSHEMSFISLASEIDNGALGSFNMSIISIDSRITFALGEGIVTEYTDIQSTIARTIENAFSLAIPELESHLTYSSLGGIAQ